MKREKTLNENICSYRNCKNEMDNKRPHAKYCCRACKSMEGAYLTREKKRIEFNKMKLHINKIENIIKGH